MMIPGIRRVGNSAAPPKNRGDPPREFRGHKRATACPVPAGLCREQMTSPRGGRVSPSGPRARSSRSWQGLQAGAQLLSSQNSAWSPRCGTTWSTTVAGTTRPCARQAAHSGCCARKAARARRQRNRSPGALRSAAGGPAPASPPPRCCTPAGRCTGGFDGQRRLHKAKPAAALPGGLSRHTLRAWPKSTSCDGNRQAATRCSRH